MSARPTARPDASPREEPEPLVAAFRALDAAGVDWCLLRGREELATDADVDLLVSGGSEATVAEALRSAGFVRLPSWGYGSHTFFFRRDEARDRWLKLDVVTELSFGPAFSLRTAAAEACLARRRSDDGVRILDPEDAFWALLLHRLLDKRSIDERSAARLRALLPHAGGDGPLTRAVAAAAPAAWPPARLVQAIGSGDLASLERRAGPALERSWSRAERTGGRRRRAAERRARATARVATAVRRPGLGVAVLGPDGAGKSTLVDGLRRSFPLPVRSIYLAPFPPGGANRLPVIGVGVRLLRLWRGWLAGRAHVARGRLVLFDRYPLDARVAPRRPLGRAGRLRRWLVGHAVPAPELVLVLDVPGSIVHARKGELDPVTLESERRQYHDLAARLPSAAVLDATRDADRVRREAIGIVWDAWTDRWRTP
jgi:thymidylate kinase